MSQAQRAKLIRGRAFKYGDDVNTDVIFPGKYTYTHHLATEVAPHALEDLDPLFVERVSPGDVVVGGRNWGCGSSREQAATCLKHNGVGAVIAKSFGRIFYRNAINHGLLVIACPEASEAIEDGDEVEIDLEGAKIRCNAGELSFPPLSRAVRDLLAAGGLIPFTLRRLQRRTPSTREPQGRSCHVD